MKSCTDRTCGPDPVCGVSCGTCLATEMCSTAGTCQCTPGTTACASDGFGFQVCNASGALGSRIPCPANFMCDQSTRRCNRPACVNAEIMLLVDRSSSMADVGAFTWVRDGLADIALNYIHGNRIGVRQFPTAAGCSVAPAPTLVLENYAGLTSSLVAPTSDATTPVTGALNGALTSFGDANDSQAVVLISQGDENCSSQAAALSAAASLWYAGVRVYAIGVTTTADRPFLDKLAAAGGTGVSRLVTDKPSFLAALHAVFGELGACRCDQTCQCGDGYLVTGEDCDDGNKMDGDGCSSLCRPTGKAVFLSSKAFSGNLGGLAGADAQCQSLAQGAGRPGTFKAWLSDSTQPAKDRLAHGTEPYVLFNAARSVVATSFAELTDGALLGSISRNEMGGPAAGVASAWTGSRADGTSAAETCGDWTSADLSRTGRSGTLGPSAASWTDGASTSCNTATMSLYCIEQ